MLTSSADAHLRDEDKETCISVIGLEWGWTLLRECSRIYRETDRSSPLAVAFRWIWVSHCRGHKGRVSYIGAFYSTRSDYLGHPRKSEASKKEESAVLEVV